jgi:chemotaxis protein MotB
MMRTLSILAVLALASGCVTQGTYDKLEAEHKTTLGQLDAEKTRATGLEEALAAEQARAKRLETQIAALEEEKAGILKDRSRLEGSVGEMQVALAELSKRKAEADARIAEYRGLLARFQSLIDAGKLRVKIVEGRMVVELASDVLFPSGSASLSKDGRAAIVEVAGLLASIPDRKFQVEGHTDNIPIATAVYPSNWELAAGRALTVVKTMVDAGMPADRISAASYGEVKPARPNDTPEGRASNRRIEIVVVPDLSSLPGFQELNRASRGES